MKKHFLLLAALALLASDARAFTAGNVVVVRIVNGTGASPVFLDEYTPNGVLVQSLALPTAVNGAHQPFAIESGHWGSGLMTRSVLKEFLVLAGYAATPGTAVAGTSAATIPRLVARVSADGTIDTTTTLPDWPGGGEPRGAAAIWADGDEDRSIWITGSTSDHKEGLRRADFGVPGSTPLNAATAIDLKGIGIYGDFTSPGWIDPAIYLTSNTNGPPLTPLKFVKTEVAFQCCADYTPVRFLTGSPWQFFLADLLPEVAGRDTLYIANDFSGLSKFCFDGTTWQARGTFPMNGAVGLTGEVSGIVTTLYITTADGLNRLVDEYGCNADITTNYPGPALIATPVPGSVFSGVAFAPDVPRVTSIVRDAASPSNSANVTFTVTFSEAVNGVDGGDFALTTTGSVTGASVTGVTGTGSTRVVTVGTGSGDGTIRLDLVDNATISNLFTIPLGGAGSGNGDYQSGEVYSIDKTAPTVVSIHRAGGSPTALANVDFTVTFSEAVSGVDATDFALAGTLIGGSIAGVAGSDITWTVTVATGPNNGTLQLNLVDDDSIIDAATNPLAGGFAGETYVIDHTLPLVSSITALDTNPSTTNAVRFTVTFSLAVNGVNAADFAFTATGLTSPAITNIETANNITYTVTTTSTGSGTLRLDVVDDDSIVAVSNAAPLGGIGAGNGSYTFGAVYAIDVVAPSVQSIVRASPNPAAGPTAAFTVTFTENVTGVDITDFAIVTTGIIGASIANVTPSSSSAVVTVHVGAGFGTLQLDLNDNGSIADVAGNDLTGSFTTGEIYAVDTIPPPLVVISQIYGGGGGGTPGPAYGNDYIEIFNRDTIPVSLSGWSVQYASAASSSWSVTPLPAVTLQPGMYLLIQQGPGAAAAPFLPTPDVAGSINLSASSGKVALVDTTTPLALSNPYGIYGVIDFVGYGSANASETNPAPAPSTTTATTRIPICNDTDNNAANFQVLAPNPHNSGTSPAPCGTFQLPPPPTGVIAAATSASSVTVSWTASASARVYEVLRFDDVTSLPALLGNTNGVAWVDNTVSSGSAYLYVVRAVDAATNRSADSAGDLATAVAFTDPSIAGSVVRAVHFQELRASINAVRVLAAIGGAPFTDPSLAAVTIKKIHIDELRAALDQARAALSLAPLSYTDPAITTATTVRAAHVTELRNGVK